MVTPDSFREFIYTIVLIAGFCVTGFFVGADKEVPSAPVAQVMVDAPHAVRLIANPVVYVAVPEHNIFAP